MPSTFSMVRAISAILHAAVSLCAAAACHAAFSTACLDALSIQSVHNASSGTQAWRVYQRGLERWLADLLQPVFDNLISDKAVPRFVQRLRILEFTLDHEAPYFDNIRRRSSRKDSDLNGVVDVRYTGGARMLLQLEVGQGRWRLKVSSVTALGLFKIDVRNAISKADKVISLFSPCPNLPPLQHLLAATSSV